MTNFYTNFYIPQNFSPESLPEKERPHFESLAYLTHITICRRIQLQKDRDGKCQDDWVSLKSEYLRNVIGWADFKKVMRMARNCGILECNGHYEVGGHSKGYRLGENYRDKKWRGWKVQDFALIQRLKSAQNKDLRETLAGRPINSFLWESLNNLTVEIPEDARAALPPHEGLAVSRILDGDFYFTQDDFGRILSNLSGLPRHLRKFLRYNGEVLSQVDIPSSQPLLIAVDILNWGTDQGKSSSLHPPLPPSLPFPPPYEVKGVKSNYTYKRSLIQNDLKKWLALCESGELYVYLIERTGLSHHTKDTFKRTHFFLSIYGRITEHKKVWNVIREDFPTVAEYIEFHKLPGKSKRWKRGALIDNSYAELPKRIQRVESDFVYESVCGAIHERNPQLPLLTIHDSVVILPRHAKIVRDTMRREFRKLGVNPSLTAETL